MSPGPLKDLKDAVFGLYARAGRPSLDEIAAEVASRADDLDLPGVPGRDTINRIIRDDRLPSSRQDTVAVAMVLAGLAGQDPATVGEQVRAAWARAAGRPAQAAEAPARLGLPVAQCDPLTLEVHPAIRLEDGKSLPELPPYVNRHHDAELAKVIEDALGGMSRIAMVVGASSTGKTRACWEAIQRLPGQWRVWHPFDPTRPDAAAGALADVGAHTVVWFNEAQHYLLTAEPELGERVAAGLRTLLTDPARAPVLVLGTIWPQYWDTLTGPPPPDDPDLHAQARELLSGTDVAVPDAWTADDLKALRGAAGGDRRLREAVRNAESARITQYLAGVPELLQRHRNAPAPARAVITAAIDARRLGHPLPLPLDLLADAAPSYLTDFEWNESGEDWLDQALAYAAKPCHGTAGPLTRIRTRPTDRSASAPPCYRLADYLQQRGSAERAAVFPPAGFWDAVARRVREPAILRAVGDSAAQRGRYRRAAALFRLAAEGGDLGSLWALANLRQQAGDLHGARVLRDRAAEASLSEPASSGRVPPQQTDDFAAVLAAEVKDREDTGSITVSDIGGGKAAEVAALRAADHGDSMALWSLAGLRERAGDLDGALELYRQAADRGDLQSWEALVQLLEETGDSAGALGAALSAAGQGARSVLWKLAVLRERSGEAAGAEDVAMLAAQRGDVGLLGSLAAMRERTGNLRSAKSLYQLAADRGDAYALWSLAGLEERLGDSDSAHQLYRQAFDRGTPSALASLAGLRERMGDEAAAERLYRRAAERGSPAALLSLAALHERRGELAQAEALYWQAADQGDASALWSLAGLRLQAGETGRAAELYRLAADRGVTAAVLSLAELAEERGDMAEAHRLALQAVDRGDSDALAMLIRVRQRTGDAAGARLMQRFGLDDEGQPATRLE